MKLIKPSYTILESQGYLKDIEIAARNCYKSEDKITDTSAQEMVDKLIKSGHNAMLEHGTVYLKFPLEYYEEFAHRYYYNKYSKFNIKSKTIQSDEEFIAVSTNYRVLIENNWLEDLQYQCEPTEFHEKRIGVRFICDRGVSHEFVRHRVFSFAQESTRYCNYSGSKFNNELTFIIPSWLELSEGQYEYNIEMQINNSINIFEPEANLDLYVWLDSLLQSEESYTVLTNENNKYANPHTKWSPQQARSVLPNSLKTELIMTGFVSDWKHFFKLRDNIAAHPQARELAQPLHEEFKKLNLV